MQETEEEIERRKYKYRASAFLLGVGGKLLFKVDDISMKSK